MNNQLFEILFIGTVRDGEDPDRVRANVGMLTNADEAKLERMFSGKPIIIKRNLDRKAAKKYRAALNRAGTDCEIRSMKNASEDEAVQPDITSMDTEITETTKVYMAQYDGDDYWAALYRRRRIIALVMILSATFSALFSYVLTPLYEASMQFYVPQDIIIGTGIPARSLIRSPGLKEQIRPYVAVLESRDAHSTVAGQLEDRSTEQVKRAADFDVTPAGSIIIYARDKDPAVATQMVALFFNYFKTFHSLRLGDSVRVVEKAAASTGPVFPITVLNVLVGAIGGLLLGIIYALFLDYLQLRTLARKLKQIEGQDWFEEAIDEEQGRHENS